MTMPLGEHEDLIVPFLGVHGCRRLSRLDLPTRRIKGKSSEQQVARRKFRFQAITQDQQRAFVG
jgi:hypothetical protein